MVQRIPSALGSTMKLFASSKKAVYSSVSTLEIYELSNARGRGSGATDIRYISSSLERRNKKYSAFPLAPLLLTA